MSDIGKDIANAYEDGYNRALKDYGIDGLTPSEVAKLAQVYRWIPIDERMPDSCGMSVLLVGINGYKQTRVFQGFTGYMERGKLVFHSNVRDVKIDNWDITHWMPLPEPPKEESENEH